MKRACHLAQQAVMVLAISLLLFVLVNIAVSLLHKPPVASDNIDYYLQHLIYAQAYLNDTTLPGIDSAYIRQNLLEVLLQSENPKGEYGYYPGGVEFLHQPFSSTHINVINHYLHLPYRYTGADTTAPYHIYCFGGSTTFGLFVNDKHTWPAQLQAALNQPYTTPRFAVFNLGVSGFSPTQETALFHELLKHGHRPSLAIFMDGINTGPLYDGSEFANGIAQRFAYTGPKPADVWALLQQLPVVQLFKPYEPNRTYEGRTEDVFPVEYSTRYNHMLAQRFVTNAQLRNWLGRQYGVPVAQFWQPSTYVEYNRNWLTPGAQKAINDTVQANYQIITKQVLQADSSFINLVPLFAQYNKPAVVDGLHYSPGFNRYLAQRVAGYIPLTDLKPYVCAPQQQSGVPFTMP